MTSEKRKEMRKYRDQAVKLEQQKNLKDDQKFYTDYRANNKIHTNQCVVEDFCHKATDKAVQESYLLLSKLVLHDHPDESHDTTARAKKLQKSKTIIFDNITNAVIVPFSADEEVTDSICSKSSIPAINVDPPTPVCIRTFDDGLAMEQKLSTPVNGSYALTPKRSATSPALNQLCNTENKATLSNNLQPIEQPALIRSNSFTLKTPSRALVEHMRQQQQCRKESIIAKQTSTPHVARDTIESKAKRIQKVDRTERPMKFNANISSDTKFKRSPYEQRLEAKSKQARHVKKTVQDSAASRRTLSAGSPAQKFRTISKTDENVLPQRTSPVSPSLPAENKQKFLRLLAEQQQEQERLLEAFAVQRNQLLQELTCATSLEDTVPAEAYHNNSAATKQFERSPSKSTMQSPQTSRRQLFNDNYNSSSICSSPFNSPVKMPTFAFEQRKRSLTVEDNVLLREQAATKINACVRGYLVRRLYRSEQVQRIVETIKDTLYFVISLHYENMEKPEEASSLTNKELKTRLLQQLLAATKALHMVFFETSLKERLDIIARDRKRIKTKMISKRSKAERKV